MPEEPTPVPAATVVPLRDEPGGGLAVLMVRRAASMAYGGMWAFPGGRIDPRDRAAGEAPDGPEAALRAAVREAAEEVGLAFPPEALVPFTHWTGGAGGGRGRRFATWYFLAPAPDGTVVLDGSETEDHRWIAPAEALAGRARGEIDMVAPTWMTLTALAEAGSVADALALGDGGRPPVRYVSRMVVRGDRRVVLWHGDAGYETADPEVPGPRHRLVMDGAHWRLDASGALPAHRTPRDARSREGD
jgi:8-oxo-dGTP pyrophosphatase MutT (NUDIX family)